MFLCSLLFSIAQAQESGALVVVVPQVRSAVGGVGCQLFGDAESFPSESARALRSVMTQIVDGTARCTFASVPPGTYAVAVMHDENGNQALDSNFLGMPTEGYGVSNNHTYAMSAPRWDESRFVLGAGQSLTLTVHLRY